MSYQERGLTFNCAGEHLVGVLATPGAGQHPTGVGVLVVVGGPQYRAGAHRQFVQFARALASQGHCVLRFDARGMGDSTGEQRTFEVLEEDIATALDALHLAAPGLKQCVLMGLCDGASAAWLYLGKTGDRRVTGVCVANPWLRSETTLAKTHLKHYYLDRLRQPEFWRKLLAGGVGAGAVASAFQSIKLALRGEAGTQRDQLAELPFQLRMAHACKTFQGLQLVVLSEADLTAQEFGEQFRNQAAWSDASTKPELQMSHIAQADHTFSQSETRRQFETLVLNWLRNCVMNLPSTQGRL